ncbi:elongation factor P maturation arginine rhamnosyltransferase EarP [Cellvibrio fontiphilus]|uniref:Protein-arginine rhamnosyltransferase n=1 Tax=Cellvibrio fontiphilus TaxID=1815559 RepID=A0ABV7FK98_9GAMM
MTSTTPNSWDIFCRVVDNFGDIGVCWRLARQLINEHHQNVRLWVDDLSALTRIWPSAQVSPQQWLEGVDVRHWPVEFDPTIEPAAVVIEAFACDMPACFLHTMAARKNQAQAPRWINLEYLSAEPWVEECHGMASVHPATGLRKTFFFPGFTQRTGGLLREQTLLAERDEFQETARHTWLAQLGIEPAADSLLISLFAYENPAINGLLQAWQQSPQPIYCLVPEGKILSSINTYLGKTLTAGDSYSSGALTLKIIPFLIQTQYDQLLWACDINFVRGEDSLVRSLWAAKPMVWHIYVQEEDAHLVKLNAFLNQYAPELPTLNIALQQFWRDWNEQGYSDASWDQLIKWLPQWQQHARRWSDQLSQMPDLARQLINYCQQT